jgi:hypothetical protein
MDGLLIDINFDTFVGRKVTMVRVGNSFLRYILNDDKPTNHDAWIEIESDKVVFTDADGKSTEISDFRNGAGLLCLLLGLTI